MWATEVSNLICSPHFRSSVSIHNQASAFALEVPIHIPPFYRYMDHSLTHYVIQEYLFCNVCLISQTITCKTKHTTYLLFMPSPYAQHYPSLSYRGGWHRVCQGFYFWYFENPYKSKINKGFDNLPSLGAFCTIPYAETHDQAFAHCQRFFTAAADADGPCFSPTVAFTPDRKAMDPWLGMLLPYCNAVRTQ